MKSQTAAVVFSTLAIATGCLHVTTESEIKPIHITMDVNLKVDRELDRQFANERKGTQGGDYQTMMDLLKRQVAGVDNMALLVAREGATEQDRTFIAESNARRLQRFKTVAKDSGASQESVQKRHAVKMREFLATGAWYQDNAGQWCQK